MSESAEIKDPVCGKVVDPLRARAVGIYGGVTRYFCSAECKAKFGDPRQPPAVLAEGAVERRREPSQDWFTDKKDASPVVDRFADLDGPIVKARREAASPSIQLEVDAMKKRTVWPWVLLALVVVVALVWLLGLRG